MSTTEEDLTLDDDWNLEITLDSDAETIESDSHSDPNLEEPTDLAFEDSLNIDLEANEELSQDSTSLSTSTVTEDLFISFDEESDTPSSEQLDARAQPSTPLEELGISLEEDELDTDDIDSTVAATASLGLKTVEVALTAPQSEPDEEPEREEQEEPEEEEEEEEEEEQEEEAEEELASLDDDIEFDEPTQAPKSQLANKLSPSPAANPRSANKHPLKDWVIPIGSGLLFLTLSALGYVFFFEEPEPINPLTQLSDHDVIKANKKRLALSETKPISKAISTPQEQSTNREIILTSEIEGISMNITCEGTEKALSRCRIAGSGKESPQLSKLEIARKVQRKPWLMEMRTDWLDFSTISESNIAQASGVARLRFNVNGLMKNMIGKITLAAPPILDRTLLRPKQTLQVSVTADREALTEPGVVLEQSDHNLFFAMTTHLEY